MKNYFAFAVMSLAATSVFAHAKLQNSAPANGATVAASPAELRLQYNEPVEAAMSTVKVLGPADAAVPAEKAVVDKDDEKTLVLTLPKLSAGDYRVEWTTMGRDGHHTKGQLRFQVK